MNSEQHLAMMRALLAAARDAEADGEHDHADIFGQMAAEELEAALA